jgi:quercetin dioxygenase-like cupin family protein
MHFCPVVSQYCGSRANAAAGRVFGERTNAEETMRISKLGLGLGCAIAGAISTSAMAQHHGVAKPEMVLQQMVDGLPRDEKQHVRVLTATFKPGDKTVTHTHRFPVTVYVLDGTFRLELNGHAPITVKAGEAMVEPPNVEMTGYNPSATEPTKVVIFYVSTPNTPFLDPAH